jgi:hypothetical protein
MVDHGLPMKARDIVLEQEASGVVLRGPGEDLRRRWLLARIASGLPSGLEIAMEELDAVGRCYDRAERHYEAALVAVEKAWAEARSSQWRKARETLLRVGAYFHVLGVEREALAATLLCEAVEQLVRVETVLPKLLISLRQVPLRLTATHSDR